MVHLNGYVHGALPWRSPCLLVAHSCMASWWQAVRREELPAGFEPYRSLVAKGLIAADLVVAPTAAISRSSTPASSLFLSFLPSHPRTHL